jgi:hypothetical protein
MGLQRNGQEDFRLRSGPLTGAEAIPHDGVRHEPLPLWRLGLPLLRAALRGGPLYLRFLLTDSPERSHTPRIPRQTRPLQKVSRGESLVDGTDWSDCVSPLQQEITQQQ